MLSFGYPFSLHQLFQLLACVFFLQVCSVHSNRVSTAPRDPLFDLNEIRHAVTSKRVVQSMSPTFIECAWRANDEQEIPTTTSSFRSAWRIEIFFADCFLVPRRPPVLIFIRDLCCSIGVVSIMSLFLGSNVNCYPGWLETLFHA